MWVSNATCCLTQRVEVGDDFPMLGKLGGENLVISARLAWIWVASTGGGAREMDARNPLLVAMSAMCLSYQLVVGFLLATMVTTESMCGLAVFSKSLGAHSVPSAV